MVVGDEANLTGWQLWKAEDPQVSGMKDIGRTIGATVTA
jgi:hypothetical protein